jgi:hypothetical protein
MNTVWLIINAIAVVGWLSIAWNAWKIMSVFGNKVDAILIVFACGLASIDCLQLVLKGLGH